MRRSDFRVPVEQEREYNPILDYLSKTLHIVDEKLNLFEQDIYGVLIEPSDVSEVKKLLDDAGFRYIIKSPPLNEHNIQEILSGYHMFKIVEEYNINDKELVEKYDLISHHLKKIAVRNWLINCSSDEEELRLDNKFQESFHTYVFDWASVEYVEAILKKVGFDISLYYEQNETSEFFKNGFAWFQTKDINMDQRDRSIALGRLLSESGITYWSFVKSFITDGMWKECKPSEDKFAGQAYRLDLDQLFRSAWEANIARILNYHQISWTYETKSFVIESHDKRSYYPDFFVGDNTVIEVKGFWDERSIKHVSGLIREYPAVDLIIIDSDVYRNLTERYKDIIPDWEMSTVHEGVSKVPLVGITQKERVKAVQSISVGDHVVLERDPGNPFDPYAVKVVDSNHNHLGFIAKDWAAIISNKLDKGYRFEAIVTGKQPKLIELCLRTVIDGKLSVGPINLL